MFNLEYDVIVVGAGHAGSEAAAAAALAAPTDDIVGGDVFDKPEDVFTTPESRDD